MSALNRGPSLPVWTPLTVASRSTTTISESGSPASSQDMHDELAETPAPSIPPSPVIRKRKGDGDGKGVNSVPKRRRMSTVATLNGDVPASAHTPPVARPGFTQPSGSGLSIPSKPNVPTSDAGRNAFSRARGLATSTSKMPQDSDSESPSEQRSCARKSAAMHPPFRRNKAQPANLSPWKEGMGLNTGSPPPLTASSRLLNGHIARKSKDYNRRHPRFMAHSQASPPGRPGNKRRQTLADPPDAIEISSSDEGTGQLRQSHASIGYPEETGKEIITIESDDEYPASPTVARRSPTVHLTTNTFDIDDHSISAEVAPEPATRNLLTPHSVLLPDESWQGDSIPPDQRILPDQEHEAIGKYSASSLPYVSLNAIATEYSSVIPASPMHIGQSYADVPSRTHEQSDMHNPTQSVLVQDDHETNPFTRVDVTAVRSPSAATLQRFDKTLTRKTSLFKSASTSHSVEVSSMENLVPSLHDMSIMSSGGMDSVNRSPSRSVDARQVQAVDTDMFDHWRNIDGSGSSTHVTKSPTSSDVGSASTYGHVVSTEEHVSLAPPSTPKTVAVLDLKTLVAQSTRKQTTRKSMSRRLKPASDSGIQFTFTPLVISPVSAVTSLISAPVAPTSQEMDTLEAPGIHGGPSNIDVGGHLYGGDGGFFKAVYGRKSSGTASKASSTHVSPPAMQGSSPTFSLGESSPAEISIPLPTEPQRETPLPISSPRAHTSKERSNTPSSGQRFSLASLLEEGLYQREHFDSAPPKPAYIITEQESSRRQTQISPVPSTSETSLPAKKRSLPIPRISRMSSLSGVRSVLEKALAEAQSRPTKQTASVIDLTLSDSEPDNEEPAESVAMEDLGSARIAARPDPGVTGCSLPVLEASDAPDSRPVEDVRMGSHSPLPDTIYTTSVVTESTITQQSEETSVEDMLVFSNNNSPDPLDVLNPPTRRTNYVNLPVATRSSSSSPSLGIYPDSPAVATPPDPVQYFSIVQDDSAVNSRLASRLESVHVDSDGDEIGGPITWGNHGKMLEYGDIALHAKDLPHSIQDVLNDLPEFARKIPGQLRHIFEQVIATNTAGDEPNAPPIQIINTVDEVECPPYEFYYTNRMWYGETVSKPDVSKLKGCDCYPTCKANPKGCSCLKKQEKFYDSGMSGFAYNKHRRLQYGEYPVFECNSKCNCCHDCPNRVVQHGREHAINIKMTEHKGWGVFAAVRIPKNTFIGIYAGEFLTDTEGERRGKVYNSGSRTYLFDIDFWHLRQDNEDWTTKYCVDAWHAGNFTRYLNHSCEPNCFIVPVYINEPDLEKPLLAIFTNRDVPAHQELCFSYFGPPDQDDQGSEPDVDSLRQGELFTRCQCGTKSCTGRMWR